jgi:RecA/RadA recombinase
VVKFRAGIKKGAISMICADSGWGKSMIGYSVLKSAYDSGMSCFIIDTENATNYEVLSSLGVNMDEVGVFHTNRIPEVKQILAKLGKECPTREDARNVFVLLDSWGPLVTEQVMEKAEEASAAADMGSTARFKNELANVLLACGFTTLVLNHVYASLQMYGDAFAIPGGKRIFFNSDAIMLASSAAKDKDKEGNILGKIITAQVKKGRAAKEFVKTKYLILHNGGVSPYFGLLDEAIECGEVYKPKPGYYSRTNFDVDKTTGEPTKMWKEDELYNKDFWIPIYQTENFRHFVEAKFAFEDQELINSSENVLAMINGTTPAPVADADEE